MSLNEATRINLQRKSQYIDRVQLYDSKPLFSWLDLSLTELCNRSAGHTNACTFCPRIDPSFYPNQNLYMSTELVESIAKQLSNLNYEGSIVLCGYGEPTLHPQLEYIVSCLNFFRVEIVTNGDFLTATKIADLIQAGVQYFVVSLYDGPHQTHVVNKKFTDAFDILQDRELPDVRNKEWYILRDRWHTAADQFGLRLTNRAGTVSVGDQDPVIMDKPCYYLAYSMQIDWNGDVLLCPQDWWKKVKFGNLNSQSLLDIWFSKSMHKRRLELLSGHRNRTPCNTCNTDGTLHGFRHIEHWNAK